MFLISVWTVLSTCEYFECTIESVLQSSRPGIGLEAPRGHIFMASALRAVLTYLVTHAATRSIYTSWKSKIINKLITMYIYIYIITIIIVGFMSTYKNDNVKSSRYCQQEVKVIWQKAPHGGPIPQLGVTSRGGKLYHWISGVGFPISVS